MCLETPLSEAEFVGVLYSDLKGEWDVAWYGGMGHMFGRVVGFLLARVGG